LGLLMTLMGLGLFFHPAEIAAILGLVPTSTLGIGTIRGDLCVFFLMCGGPMLMAAYQRNTGLLILPLILIGGTLFGRTISLFFGTVDFAVIQTMGLEAVMVGVMVAARRTGLGWH